jgi:thioredoxin-related protein
MANNNWAKIRFLVVVPCFIWTSTWHTSLEDAKTIALKNHKYILLNFSGSDWCGPCIRLKKEIFETNAFQSMADSELVLVNSDFPRNKKNQLSSEQQKINDATADKYNAKGIFPYTLLLNAEGKILGTWEGLPDETPENFIQEIHNDIYTSTR